MKKNKKAVAWAMVISLAIVILVVIVSILLLHNQSGNTSEVLTGCSAAKGECLTAQECNGIFLDKDCPEHQICCIPLG